jgi:hypothetical protein
MVSDSAASNSVSHHAKGSELLVVRGVKRDADEEHRDGKHEEANNDVHL